MEAAAIITDCISVGNSGWSGLKTDRMRAPAHGYPFPLLNFPPWPPSAGLSQWSAPYDQPGLFQTPGRLRTHRSQIGSCHDPVSRNKKLVSSNVDVPRIFITEVPSPSHPDTHGTQKAAQNFYFRLPGCPVKPFRLWPRQLPSKCFL